VTLNDVPAIATRGIAIVAVGIIGALVIGWDIAQGNLTLPTVVAIPLVLGLVARWAGVPADPFLGGILLVGYLVGNRGFAQLNVPGIPLLPGEAVLGLALALTLWRAARTQTLPLRRDALNALVLLWIAVGATRLPFDFQHYHLSALRDFAMIYYALFFFLAQAWAEQPAARRWLVGALTVGLALCGPIFYLFDLQQEWVTSNLTLGNVPLIFVKSDVAGGFMAAAVLWFAQLYSRLRHLGWLLLTSSALFGTVICNSRAAVIALGVGLLWLLILRQWRVLRPIALLVTIGLLALLIQAVTEPRPLTTLPLYRLYESATSIVDLDGTRVYQVADLSDKPDNNQFRLVWWSSVISETWHDGPWLGLGFGRDLAAEFLRTYYADNNNDFTARSPHNFLLTVFGRMGLLGEALILAIIAIFAVKTWRAGRTPPSAITPSAHLPLWLTGWTVLTSACFGVVLEGPMGATLFWTVLGLANASPMGSPPPLAPAPLDPKL